MTALAELRLVLLLNGGHRDNSQPPRTFQPGKTLMESADALANVHICAMDLHEKTASKTDCGDTGDPSALARLKNCPDAE